MNCPTSLRIGAALIFGLIVAAGVTACRREESVESKGGTAPAYGEADPKFDPVLVNGPIFQDWPAPDLTIVMTGLQQGYLEPCGCAGLENQKGGLGRRHAMIRQLEQDGWSLVKVDMGDQIRRFGRQAEIKFQHTVGALETMGYDVAAFGPGELSLPTDDLVVAASEFNDGASRFVSANVGVFGFDSGFTMPYRIVEQGGKKVGVTSVLGETYAGTLHKDDLEILPAAEALRDVLPKLQAEGCDVLILLAEATLEESQSLAREFPEFDIVVSAGGADEPPAEPHHVDGNETQVVELGHKGMYAAVIGLYDDAETPLRYQRVPLDSRFAATPAMKDLLVAYQTELEELGLERLGLRPMAHPRSLDGDDPLLGEFVGAAACGECHKKAYEKWASTPHAHATESLTKLTPPRQFDPECLSCHVTGWNAQDYVPYETGFASLEASELLTGNGCENCHGPGGAHVAAEKARGAERDLATVERLRAMMRLSRAVAFENTCIKCHDHDNSPEFDPETYWPKVEHPWKD